MTDPNAKSPDGTAVSTNITWGDHSTLIVDATGVSTGFGALNFSRNGGTVAVGIGAKLQINANAIVNLNGNQDALNDGTRQVDVVNNGLLQTLGRQ